MVEAFAVTPEYGQGADLRATETDISGTLGAADPSATDRVTLAVSHEDVARTVTAGVAQRFDGDTEDFVLEQTTALEASAGGADDNDAQGGKLVVDIHEPREVVATLDKTGSSVSNQSLGTEGGLKLATGTVRGFDEYNQADTGDVMHTVAKGNKPTAWDPGSTVVRRLTPVECLRLQGFPDDWAGEPLARPDGPVYQGCGDAVTSHVMEWIGVRLGVIAGAIS